MPDPIPSNNISADRIRSDWGISGQFSMNSFRGKTYFRYSGNPNNNNYPYGITTYPSSPIKFSDFRFTIPAFTIDICIVSGGGGGGGNVYENAAGGGGAGGSIFFTSINVPDGSDDNLGGWNKIFIAVGGGGSGGGNNIAGNVGGTSYLQYNYITPSTYSTILHPRAGGGGGGGGGYDGRPNTVTYTSPSVSHTGNGGGGGASYRALGIAYSPRSGSAATGERGGGQGLYVSDANRKLFLSHGGGGGGSGGNGTSATESKAGNGGAGTDLTWFLGSGYTYNPVMGGGGGGASYYISNGTLNYNLNGFGGAGSGGTGGSMGIYANHGVENRGGGGGGATSVGNISGEGSRGGNGGSGVVFIRYRNDKGVQKMTGGEVTTILNNTYYLHAFKSSGVIYTLYT